MELNHPLAVVTPTLDGDVLYILARAEAEFTPGRVHRMLGGRSEEGVRKVLKRLAEQGIVRRRRAGPSYLYSLNRDHVSYRAIALLCDVRSELLRRLHAHLIAWPSPPVYGALFGSAARSDMHSGSDLDIFLVRPFDCNPREWDIHTMQLARDATAWTGNDARVLEMTEAEVATMSAEHGVLASISRDALPFWGRHDRLPARADTESPDL